jgi:hypothetical protein
MPPRRAVADLLFQRNHLFIEKRRLRAPFLLQLLTRRVKRTESPATPCAGHARNISALTADVRVGEPRKSQRFDLIGLYTER